MRSVCDRIKNKYIWSLSSLPDIELLKFLEFPGNRTVFYSNEATLGGPLESFRVGLMARKTQGVIRGLESSASFPHIQEEQGAGD